jgi:hypothetical protein
MSNKGVCDPAAAAWAKGFPKKGMTSLWVSPQDPYRRELSEPKSERIPFASLPCRKFFFSLSKLNRRVERQDLKGAKRSKWQNRSAVSGGSKGKKGKTVKRPIARNVSRLSPWSMRPLLLFPAQRNTQRLQAGFFSSSLLVRSSFCHY